MSRNRKPLSKRLRYMVLRRDGFACQYCGAKAPDVRLHVDHIVPLARGGTDDIRNLRTACADCNGGKGTLGGKDEDCFEDEIDEGLEFIYCDPHITSLYGEIVV